MTLIDLQLDRIFLSNVLTSCSQTEKEVRPHGYIMALGRTEITCVDKGQLL